jgi:T4 superinfection immunity protein
MAEDPSLAGVIGVIVLVNCYFMPTIIALARDKRRASGVALVNFFLGWTVIGWLAAFIWSCTGKTRADDRREAKRHQEVIPMPRRRSLARFPVSLVRLR